MKLHLLHFLLLSIIMLILLPYSPWWAIFILPMFVSFIWHKKSYQSLIISFLSGLCIWSVCSMYFNIQNDYLLASSMGNLFGGIPATLLPLVSGVIGGAYAALGGYLGQLLKNKVSKKPKLT